jgi:hypothetical protein
LFGRFCSAINELRDVCFQDQNGFLTKLSSSTSLTFGTVNGPVLGGLFAAREENLKAVIGDLGTNPFGGNVMLSGNAEKDHMRGKVRFSMSNEQVDAERTDLE